jgi:hypothetical protein
LPLRFRIDTRFACDIGEPPDSLGLSLERAIPLDILFAPFYSTTMRQSSGFVASYFSRFS